MPAEDLRNRIDTLEKAYEYFLAYAAQGLTMQTAEGKDGEARRSLTAGLAALDGLSDRFSEYLSARGSEQATTVFLEVLERDAQATGAAFELVLAQTTLSSQLIDNLNASLHVRALLTDLFLLDEALQIPADDDQSHEIIVPS